MRVRKAGKAAKRDRNYNEVSLSNCVSKVVVSPNADSKMIKELEYAKVHPDLIQHKEWRH